MLKIARVFAAVAAVSAFTTPATGAPQASKGQGNTCPVLESSFEAFINAMPGPNASPTLIVSGSVTLPTAGYTVRLTPGGKQPPTATFNLHLTSPQQAAQVVTSYPVRAEMKATADYQTVVIRCGGKEIARVTNIEKAF